MAEDVWKDVDINKLLVAAKNADENHQPSKFWSIKTDNDAIEYFQFNVHVSFRTTAINIIQPIMKVEIKNKTTFNSSTMQKLIRALADSDEINKKIEILSVSMRIFKDDISGFVQTLQYATSKGCTIQIVLAEQNDNFLFLHPQDQLGQSKGTIANILGELRALSEQAKKSIFVYQHNFAIYSSTYRIGNAMVVVPHVYKKVSVDTNIIYFEDQEEFNTYAQQFADIVNDTSQTKHLDI